MSGVLCFTSQDGPFADGSETEVSFSAGDENPTFIYRNEQELEQVASLHDADGPSILQLQTQLDTSRAPTTEHKDDAPVVSIGGMQPIHGVGPFWMFLGKIFNSTIVSIVLIIVTVVLSLVLGGVSVFVVKPSPYFDKSLDAFQIPDHESTMRLEAFDLAKRDISFSKLKKRSVDDVFDDDIMPQYSQTGNDAMNNDAITSHDLNEEHIPGSNSGESNNKLFMKYKKDFNLPPINDIHRMDMGGAPFEEAPPPETYLSSRQRRSPRRYRTSSWKLQMVYIAQGKGELNIFTPERLKTIHDVEMSIMKHDRFSDFCARNVHSFGDPALREYNYCLPPNSLMTYFYPSKTGNQIRYDGVGSELADVEGTLAWAMQEESFYWYVDTEMNSANRSSSFIRSEIYFGRPVGEDNSIPASEQFGEYKKFVTSYVKLLNKASTSEVSVLYGGTEIFDYEVTTTINHDLLLALPCVISITILLFIFTSFSFWLTICGALSIFLSFAWAYFVFHVLCGIDALGLLNLVSAFLVIGIGVDDVFVFVNTFRQAEHILDPRVRMAYTLKMAGTATFFTSVTTAGAFAANMASQIPAIYSFGLFMMLIVSFCWVTVLLIMPAALNLWQRWIHCEVYCFPSGKPGDSMTIASPGLQRVLTAHEQQTQHQQQQLQQIRTVDGQQLGTVLDDGDIPMLDIDDDLNNQNATATNTACQQDDIPINDTDDSMIDIRETSTKEPGLLSDDDDVPIIDLNSVTVTTAVQGKINKKNQDGLTKLLQTFLRRFVADPVIKARWVVIGIYLFVVGITLILVFQIHPSDRPPALYKEDTNLQRLLDLAYNFSGKDISCKSCSGFTQSRHAPPPMQPVTLPPINLPPTTKTDQEEPFTLVLRHDVTTSEPTKPHQTTAKPAVQKDTTSKPATTLSITTKPSVPKTCADVNLNCLFGAKCVDDPQQGPICQCSTGCPIIIRPLCDTEGQTHVSECEMKVVGCQLQKHFTVAHLGKCQDTPGDNLPPPSGGSTHSTDLVPGGSDPLPGPGGATSHVSTPGENYNPCQGGDCGNPADRPILDTTAVVYIVFGVKGVDRSNVSKEHVINTDKGIVIYDDEFNAMDMDTIRALCIICKTIAARKDLVISGGAECFPDSIYRQIGMQANVPSECENLPVPNLLNGQRSKAIGKRDGRTGRVVWFAMAFESITYMGKSSFEAYKDYLLWHHAVEGVKSQLTPKQKIGLDSAFQTCEFWRQVFMEIIGVTSAIYGLAFSLLVCIVAVVIFTAHIGIMLIAFFTISGVILVVISMFYLLGWQMGAVEAVSLSILVGSSVDYCIHLIEGYLVAGDEIPNSETKSNGSLRQWRTRQALMTIGVSILSSAVTTLIAAIPLSCTTIQLFAKFGKIVAINTLVSIVFTLTACSAFLSCFAPAKYKWNVKWLIISSLIVIGMFGSFILALYSMHLSGYAIPGPSGNSLF